MTGNDNITLNLQIGQRTVTVTVPKSIVIYYKEAEQIINNKFLEFAKKWNYSDHQDLLSKILLDTTVKWIENEERLAEQNAEIIPMMEQLNEIAKQLDNGE